MYENDNWNEIVEILKTSNVSNKQELTSDIQSCFRLLGWKRTNSTMIPDYEIESGNHIDIALLSPAKSTVFLPIYAMPLITPNIIQFTFDKIGCKSLMLIGDSIDIYNRNENTSEITCICQIPLIPNDEIGNEFVKVLDAAEFNESNFLSFCGQLAENNSPRSLIKNEIKNLIDNPSNIKEIIYDYFINKGFDNVMLENELKYIDFKASPLCHHGEEQETGKEIIKHDSTKFSFDGKEYYSKKKFVLMLIKQYVVDNPDITIEDLERIFPSEIISKNRGVVRPLETVREWIKENPDVETRYCMKEDEIISLKNGMKVVVHNQWGTKHFPAFLQIAKTIYNIRSNQPYEFELPQQSRITISSKSFNTFNKKLK